MKLSLSKIGLLLALPFIGVVFFDAYQLVELLNIGSQQKRFGISMFLSAAYPWALVLNPIMQKIYVLLETRTAEPMYIFWLVCTALNAVLAYISGASVNLKSLSKVGAVLGGGIYLLVCLATWGFVLFNIETGNLLGFYLNLIGSPFSVFLAILFGHFGFVIAVIYNSALLYSLGSLLGKTAVVIKGTSK